MKAVNLGGGPWGRLLAITATAAVAVLVVALFLGGCGGDNQGATGSQLDEEADGPVFDQTVTPVGRADEGEVLPGYTEDQCIAEMTARYGSQDVAGQVCNEIQTGYGSDSNPPELAAILPAVEASLGVTPVPGAPPPSGGSTTPPADGNNSGNDGGNNGGSGNGWDSGIEITVPPAP